MKPGFWPLLAKAFVVVRDKFGTLELGRQFFVPLLDQPRRGEDEHTLHHLTQQILLEHQPSLDGLAPNRPRR